MKQTWPAIRDVKERYIALRAAFDDSPERLLEAIRRHSKETRVTRGGDLIGSWPPSTADVKLQLDQMDKEARERQSQRKTIPIPKDHEVKVVPLTGQMGALRKYFRKDYLEIHTGQPTCDKCKDSGRVWFYYAKGNHRQVLLEEDWNQLHSTQPKQAMLYRANRATCSCSVGQQVRQQQFGSIPPHDMQHAFGKLCNVWFAW